MSREDIEEAIEVLEDASAQMLAETGDENYYDEAINALRQALETEQEPVAHIDHRIHSWPDCFVIRADPPHTSPLYLSLPKREWVGLTAPEVQECYDLNPARFASRIEAKLKEKNA